ncbi:MAG: class I SAM-dependent methyltransferase [Acidimicrobiia bacterium]
MPLDDYRLANRANWDARVDIHFPSKEYGVDRFASDPTHLSDVVTFDKEKLGDVTGKSLIHLQCHIGTDTISWARLGAEVTGIDLSEKSIAAAELLSRLAATPGRFVVSELYDAPSVVPEKFDIVYTGAGAICWLPDIDGWARVVASFLDPGGVFYMREGHPMMWALDWEDMERLSVTLPYFETPDPFAEVKEETYAGDGVVVSPLNYTWNHGIGEILTALLDAGFRIDAVEEYDFCDWQGLDQMVQGDDGYWRLPDRPERLPLMWSVRATRV